MMLLLSDKTCLGPEERKLKQKSRGLPDSTHVDLVCLVWPC